MASLQTMPGGAPAPTAGVAAAIERVLAAERAAEADLEDCRRRAAQRLAEARQQAREIAGRAERLAQAIHARTERVAAARAARAAASPATTPPSDLDLSDAIDRLAADLTGGGDG